MKLLNTVILSTSILCQVAYADTHDKQISQLQDELKQLQAQQAKQITDLNNQLQTQLKQIQSDLQKQIQTANSQVQQQIKDLHDSTQKEMAQLQQQMKPK